MQLELNLNSNSIQFKLSIWIQFFFFLNDMQISAKSIGDYGVEKIKVEKIYIDPKKRLSNSFLLGNQLNIFQSKGQLMKPKIVLPRLVSMNHH
jgi:hypothetical protein